MSLSKRPIRRAISVAIAALVSTASHAESDQGPGYSIVPGASHLAWISPYPGFKGVEEGRIFSIDTPSWDLALRETDVRATAAEMVAKRGRYSCNFGQWQVANETTTGYTLTRASQNCSDKYTFQYRTYRFLGDKGYLCKGEARTRTWRDWALASCESLRLARGKN